MKTIIMIGLVCLGALACRTTPESRVLRYGPDRYTISYGSTFGYGKARRACIRDANAYCESLGKQMVPVEEGPTGERASRHRDVAISGFQLIFRCEESE